MLKKRAQCSIEGSILAIFLPENWFILTDFHEDEAKKIFEKLVETLSLTILMLARKLQLLKVS